MYLAEYIAKKPSKQVHQSRLQNIFKEYAKLMNTKSTIHIPIYIQNTGNQQAAEQIVRDQTNANHNTNRIFEIQFPPLSPTKLQVEVDQISPKCLTSETASTNGPISRSQKAKKDQPSTSESKQFLCFHSEKKTWKKKKKN